MSGRRPGGGDGRGSGRRRGRSGGGKFDGRGCGVLVAASALLGRFRAAGAAARLAVFLVLALVVLELGSRFEIRDAVLARVRVLARVGLEVPAQVRYLHEEPVAVRTPERLLASVKPHVRLEVVVPGETLLANRAHERLLAGVGALMVLEHVFVAELLTAHGALEWPALSLPRRRANGRRIGRRRGRRDGRRLVVGRGWGL